MQSGLSQAETDELFELLEQTERERVAPKFEQWRKPYEYKIAFGGRGAGAKTESAFSLAVQFCETPDYFGENVNVLVTREVESTIDLSSYQTVVKKVKALGYERWAVLKSSIVNKKNGSRIAFRGLSDLTADNFRGVQDLDILIVEEAHKIGYKAWQTVLPSLRKKGCEVWVLFNRVEDLDPCYDLFVKNERPNSCILELRPGNLDNPWFDESALPGKRAADYARDPEDAIHIWEGLPRKQGDKAVLSRVAIRAAMDRKVEAGSFEALGVDVARFGDDKTTFAYRKGMKGVKMEVRAKIDTQETARIAWDMVGRNPQTPIKVDDTGVGGGVTDKLKDMGANVIPINFGGLPKDKELYTSAADEMWFEFAEKLDEMELPDDQKLMQELSGRQFKYTIRDQRKIETKDEFKKRLGRSPDRADAWVLAFYSPKVQTFAWEL